MKQNKVGRPRMDASQARSQMIWARVGEVDVALIDEAMKIVERQTGWDEITRSVFIRKAVRTFSQQIIDGEKK